MILAADSKGSDQTAHLCRLIWAFAVPTSSKGTFLLGVAQFSMYDCDNSLKVCCWIDLQVTVTEHVCSCAPSVCGFNSVLRVCLQHFLLVSTPLRFILAECTFAIHVGDSSLQFVLSVQLAICVGNSQWWYTFIIVIGFFFIIINILFLLYFVSTL